MTWRHLLGGILLAPVVLLLTWVMVSTVIKDWRSSLIAAVLVLGLLGATVGGLYLITGGH